MDNSSPGDLLDAAKRAIAFAGGPAALARYMRAEGHTISTQAISQWKKVPPNRVRVVESATRGNVSCYEMAPRVYGVKA